MVNVERYPDLKASQNFLALQEELSSTENKISFARQAYNDSVTRYNTRIQTIPANLVAGPAGFTKRELFELTDDAERAVPEVQVLRTEFRSQKSGVSMASEFLNSLNCWILNRYTLNPEPRTLNPAHEQSCHVGSHRRQQAAIGLADCPPGPAARGHRQLPSDS